MGFQLDTILKRIHNCTPEALEFINIWFDKEPFISARTSGSTGTPKEIRLLKEDMIASANSTNKYFGINGRSTLLCPLSANYIAGKMMIVRAIASGAKLWIEPPTNQPMQTDCGMIDLIAVVPSQVPHLLDHTNKLSRIKRLLIGGAQISDQLSQRIINSGADAFLSYGMTETCSHVALRKISRSDEEIYEAMPDIFFSRDTRGCLVISSDSRSFKSLHTNDMAELIDQRHFLWKGRFDNVINSGGIKVHPEEIEKQLRSLIPDEIEYYITKSNDQKWGEVPVLIISDNVPEPESLLKTVRECVKTKVQRPAKIIVDDIKHTASGKIIRRNSF